LDARCEPHPSIRYQQIFPQWQRREITESVISGRKSGAEMARLYNISAPTVSRTVAAHRAAAENGRCFGIRSVSSQASLLNPPGLVIQPGLRSDPNASVSYIGRTQELFIFQERRG
jgi:hypothetical protein